MEKVKLLGRRILRKIYTALGLTAAALVFQACYGTPQSLGLDVCIQGLVKSKKQKSPVRGIKVSVKDMPQYELTDNYGKFQFYVQQDGNCVILFEDIDGAENGVYAPKEIIVYLPEDKQKSSFQMDLGDILLDAVK